ncbi:hypothetical protein [Microbacterium sp. A1-JK]|uniref:hypothetical protein n=1 Tax=Microbacterium sp. A1-JK TaxID=3177516 RepID=UPI0038881B7A
MNRIGAVVLGLFAIGLLMAGIALARGHVDGAAVLAAVAILYAVALTAWAAHNRRTKL